MSPVTEVVTSSLKKMTEVVGIDASVSRVDEKLKENETGLATVASDGLPYLAWDEIKLHNNRKSTWLVYENKVYDTTKFLEEHPGGEEVMLETAGMDSTNSFNEIGHTQDTMLIGHVHPAALKNEAITKPVVEITKTVVAKSNQSMLVTVAPFFVLLLAVCYYRFG